MLSNGRLRSLVPILLLIALCLPSAHAQTSYPGLDFPQSHAKAEAHDSVVCRLPAILGFDAVGETAKEYVGHETTSVPDDTKVYVTVENGKLYLHSNFLTPGYDNASKLATSRTDFDLQNLTFNLIGKEEESHVSEEAFLSAFPKMRFIVDGKLFIDPTFADLDFNNAAHVSVIGKDGVVRESVKIALPTDKFRRLVRYEPNLYARVEDSSATATFKKLQEAKFDAETIKLLSLVINTDTEAAVAALPASRVVNAGDYSLAAVKNALQHEAGQNVFFLGHVEGDAFVTRDSSGTEVSRIRMSDLDEISRTTHVKLFPLGCNSASVHATGVAASFNTVDAVKRFSAALSSSNWTDFYTKLSSPDLMLVLDSSVLTSDGSTKITFEVHPQKWTSQKPFGTITHYLSAPISTPPSVVTTSDSSDDSGVLIGLFVVAGIGVGLYLVVKLIRRA
jgi:hypothetical protein